MISQTNCTHSSKVNISPTRSTRDGGFSTYHPSADLRRPAVPLRSVVMNVRSVGFKDSFAASKLRGSAYPAFLCYFRCTPEIHGPFLHQSWSQWISHLDRCFFSPTVQVSRLPPLRSAWIAASHIGLDHRRVGALPIFGTKRVRAPGRPGVFRRRFRSDAIQCNT